MHDQAFHTSCREGLSGQAGFQFNAASPGLTTTQLDALATVHAGYQSPRDLPPQPTEAELASFPVALRCAPADGVGPAVSRTVYVGREFRGANGEPDAGRFGNYFSHIVVGEDDTTPFGDFLPIEFWNSAFWREVESQNPQLAPIRELEAGSLDIEAVASVLKGERRRWIPQVIDAAFAAVAGRARLVVVEEPGELAASWVALVSFALPRAAASQMTFSTFEGRPRNVSVNLCCTTAGCDVAFEPHEIGRTVSLLDVVHGTACPDETMLLGRVVERLVVAGGEALATATRALDGLAVSVDPRAVGALLAVAGSCAEIARDDAERCSIVDVARKALSEGRTTDRDIAALATLANSDAVIGEAERTAWLGLHAAARNSADPRAPEAVQTALGVLIPLADRFNTQNANAAPSISAASPVHPPVTQLAAWLELLDGIDQLDVLANMVAGGWRLGLVGVNSQLDRDLGSIVVRTFDNADVQRAFVDLAGDPGCTSVVRAVATGLADRAIDSPVVLQRLVTLSQNSIVFDAVQEYAEAADTFGARFVAITIELARAPQQRREAAGRLALYATEQSDHAAIRSLFDLAGLRRTDELFALIAAYGDQGLQPPPDALRLGWQSLSRMPLASRREISAAGEIARAISTFDREGRGRGEYLAWYMAAHVPSDGRPSESEWIGWFAACLQRPEEEFPDDRFWEILELAAGVVFDSADWQEQVRSFETVAHLVTEEAWAGACQNALEKRVKRSRDPAGLIANLFAIWAHPSVSDKRTVTQMFERVLPPVVDRWSARRRDEVRQALPTEQYEGWDAWSKAFPPSSAVGQKFGRMLGRKARS